jgi:hypothetical protein
MDETVTRLIAAAKALADSVSFDDNGTMIGSKWIGGNGGLISRDTIVKADAVRRAVAAFDNEAQSAEGGKPDRASGEARPVRSEPAGDSVRTE